MYSKNRYTTVLLIILTSGLSAQTAAEYTFLGADPATDVLNNGSVPASSSGSGFTAGGLSAPGLTTADVYRPAKDALNPTDALDNGGSIDAGDARLLKDHFAFAFWNQNSDGNTLAQVLSRNNEYVSFSVTPDSGLQMELTSVSFDFWSNASNQMPSDIALFSSVDSSFSTGPSAAEALEVFNPSAGTVSDNGTTLDYSGVNSLSHTLDAVDFGTITGSVEFRLYFAKSEFNSAKRFNWIDNLQVDGTTSPIPEPSQSALLLGLLCISAVGIGRRRARQS